MLYFPAHVMEEASVMDATKIDQAELPRTSNPRSMSSAFFDCDFGNVRLKSPWMNGNESASLVAME